MSTYKPMMLVAPGERYTLRAPNGRFFEGLVVGAWAVVEQNRPRRGWFPAIVIFEEEGSERRWEYRTEAFIDFDDKDPLCIRRGQPGLMTITIPPMSPLVLDVKPFKPHR